MKHIVILSSIALALAACAGGGGGASETPAAAGPAAPAKQPTTEAQGPPPVAGAATQTGLAGTQWRLVEIQSMDDAQGTTRPDDANKYTLAFGKDGRVAARLDCNRGTGAWKSTVTDAASGAIEIGQLAMTRAMCPPPTLDAKLATQLGYVRSYILRDERLFLALMADGGILVWEPIAAAQ